MDRVLIHPNANLTARSAGMRLLLALLERQALEVPIHVALTGGTMGVGMLEAIRGEALIEAVMRVKELIGRERLSDYRAPDGASPV